MITYLNTAGFEARLREMYRPLGEDEVLEKALDVLRNEGWTQGALEHSDGTVCALGALNKACTGSAQTQPRAGDRNYTAWSMAARRLEQILFSMGVHADDVGIVIPNFNDYEGTTYEDVTLVFKRALAEAQDESAS